MRNKKGWFSPTHSSLYKFVLKRILVDVCFSPATHAQATHGNTQNVWFHQQNIISPRKFIIQQIQTGFSYNRYSFFSLAIWNPLLSPTTCVCLRTLMIGNPGTNKSLNIAFSWFNINTSPTCQLLVCLFYKVLCWKQHQSFSQAVLFNVYHLTFFRSFLDCCQRWATTSLPFPS